MIVCVYVWVWVCVSNTTKLQKDYIFKMSFILWLETDSFSETRKSFIVIVYFECLRGPSMLLLFTPVDSHWRECVAAAKNLCRKERVFENDVFTENTRLVGGSKRRTNIYART